MALNHKQRKECYNNANMVLDKWTSRLMPTVCQNKPDRMTTESFCKISKPIPNEIEIAYHLEFGSPLLPAADRRGWKLRNSGNGKGISASSFKTEKEENYCTEVNSFI